MYGMSAKDRMAMFENKGSNSSKTSSTPARKKIGKLNVGENNTQNNSTPPKKTKPGYKEKAKVEKKDEKPKEEVKEPVKEEVKEKKAASAKVEPKQAREKPTQIKEEPKSAKIEPKQVKEEPKPAQEQPKKAKEEVKSAQEQPKQVKDEPKSAKEQPKQIKEEPKSAKEQPKQVKEEPKSAKEQPKQVKEECKTAQEQPKQVKEEPKSAQEQPKQVKEEPKSAKEQPKQVKEEPKSVKAEHTPAKQESAKVEPKKSPEKPVQEIKKESKPMQEAEKTVKEPPKQMVAEKAEVVVDAKPVKKEEIKLKEEPKVTKEPAEPKKELPDQKIEEETKANVEEKTPEEQPQVELTEPAKPKVRPLKARMPLFKAIPEEFYDTLFYFSGMGTVVGSALNEGVYVPQRATKTALDTDVIENVEADKDKEREHDTYLIRTARKQAFDIAEELRKLQGLLFGLPTFVEENGELHKIDRKPFDNIMHAKYFQVAKPQDDTTPKRQPPSKQTEQQWPPPATQPVAPIKVDVQSKEFTKPASQVSKDVGVFKGKSDEVSPSSKPDTVGVRPYGVHTAKPQVGSKPWQEKYGSKLVSDTKAPEPFHAPGEIPTGLKPWELSRLRGLEAKGYQFNHEYPESGADHSDDFYHGRATMDMELTSEVTSLAPYLVSKKTKQVDRQVLSQEPITAGTFTLQKEFYGSQIDSLPYSDV